MITMLTRVLRGSGEAISIAALTLFFLAGAQGFAHAEPGDIPTDTLPSACSDGIDNDGDGLVDFIPLFGDPGCDDIFDTSEIGGGGGGGDPVPSISECNDGIDNDNDGLIDFVPTLGDPDCDNIADTSESASGGGGGSSPVCSDGIDNDGDGKVDGVDPGCSDASDTDETDPTGGGGDGGGGGGGPAAACEDSIDNDGDSLIDMADPGCGGPSDNDESSGGSGGGSGGGGGSSGGGSSATTAPAPVPEILGASTTEAAACDTYLTAFIKSGAKNDIEQVMRLQKVLKEFEGAAVEENGDYDSATLNAVHAFQTKYADDILTPWGIKKSTGFVYLTTRKKVNEIRCENKITFPYTTDELKKIEEVRLQGVPLDDVSAPSPSVSVPASKVEVKTDENAKKNTDSKAVLSKKDEEVVQSSGLRKAWDFLGRLFNRGR